MKGFLHKKGVTLSLKTYFITSLSFMALGLFSSLIIGLIIRTVGQQIKFLEFLVPMGQLAMDLMGPAIGVAVAYGLKAPRLVLFPAVVIGAAGAALGGPAGAFIATLFATEIGKLVSKETRLDIIITPFVTIATGYTIANTLGQIIASGIDYFGMLIMWSVERQPFVMGILVALLMGLALTAPISSAAIAFMLGLEGIAAGAATVGCAAQMIGFATSSYRENGFSGFIALGIGTSMLQVANIIRNPIILIPPTVAGMVLAPFATMMFQMVNNPAGAGMGTSGLVGQIMTFTVMGFSRDVLIGVVMLHFIGPAVISLLLSEGLRKAGLIKFGDMKIEQ
ncbi:PTS sugar transporter subunit IIC [Anaerobacillus sp. CMMVII]|uniref:PTS transporter subunit IIC n=1 Tax=Anaerobacillus sp. CMMVII TaxID=2755588 RepID=UPI0021B7DB03|nr:PTS sugar transporter subunit IIC [Anaerobacillus sp. CMMVII]MCT8137327.1 PTS sugar transporter subunit IIC [Anaerobacillus sp. CMMVII]